MEIAYAILGKAFAYALACAVSVAAASWAAVKFVPQEWLKHKFEKQLQEQRAQQERGLQEIKHRLEVLMRRTSKLHEKEFDVLSDVWPKLNEALGLVALVVSAFQSYADLQEPQVSEERFRAFVKGCDLPEIDKQELLTTPRDSRNEFYQERTFWHRLRKAKHACTELHRAIQGNSIFFDPAIRERFLKIDEAAWNVLISREVGEEAQDITFWRQAGQKFSDEVVPLKTDIEKLVQKRLGYD